MGKVIIQQTIDALRLEKTWSISKLARECNVSVQRAWGWCHGDYAPDALALQTLCQVFDVDVAEIDLSIYRKDKAAV